MKLKEYHRCLDGDEQLGGENIKAHFQRMKPLLLKVAKHVFKRQATMNNESLSYSVLSCINDDGSGYIQTDTDPGRIKLKRDCKESFKSNLRKSLKPLMLKIFNELVDRSPTDKPMLTSEILQKLKRNFNYLVVGIQASGKSTFIELLKGSSKPSCSPTLGFRPVRIHLGDDDILTFYDIGGCDRLRKLWCSYLHDAHCVIQLVCPERLEESIECITDIINHAFMTGKPFLVIINWRYEEGRVDHDCNDLELTVRQRYLRSFPSMHAGNFKIITTCLHHQSLNCPLMVLNEGIEWLISKTLTHERYLSSKIQRDEEQVRKKKTEAKRERERSTIKRVIRALQQDSNGESIGLKDNYLPREYGLALLQETVGEDNILTDSARRAAKLVGYHKLALLILANMLLKDSFTWEALLHFIVEIRDELLVVEGSNDTTKRNSGQEFSNAK